MYYTIKMTKNVAVTKLNARARILETAYLLFYQKGVGNVGIEQIIRESGVAKATLYNHFKSKDELILAYMRLGDLRWRSWMQQAVLEQNPDPRAHLMAFWDALEEKISHATFRGCVLGNVLTELADPQHPAALLLREHKAAVRELFVGWALEREAAVPMRHSSSDIADVWMLLLEGAMVLAAREGHVGAVGSARGFAAKFLEETVILPVQATPDVEVQPSSQISSHISSHVLDYGLDHLELDL